MPEHRTRDAGGRTGEQAVADAIHEYAAAREQLELLNAGERRVRGRAAALDKALKRWRHASANLEAITGLAWPRGALGDARL